MASEHLRLMQRSGLLASEKDGRKAYYRVADPHLANILACVEARFGRKTPVGLISEVKPLPSQIIIAYV